MRCSGEPAVLERDRIGSAYRHPSMGCRLRPDSAPRVQRRVKARIYGKQPIVAWGTWGKPGWFPCAQAAI